MLTFLLLALTTTPPADGDPWAGAAGDVGVVSHGEDFELAEAAVPGSWTIVDFSASWCEPCHRAAHHLRPYVEAHPDVAVRVVDLSEGFGEAAHHLGLWKAIPYFVVYDPQGKRIYRGHDPIRAMAEIEAGR